MLLKGSVHKDQGVCRPGLYYSCRLGCSPDELLEVVKL